MSAEKKESVRAERIRRDAQCEATPTGTLSTRFLNSGKPRPRFGRVPQQEAPSGPVTAPRDIRITEGNPQGPTSHWLRDRKSRKGETKTGTPRWRTN